MFADSFSVLSIHRVARGLVASFVYKCAAASSRGSLRQHGLLVYFVTLLHFNVLKLLVESFFPSLCHSEASTNVSFMYH